MKLNMNRLSSMKMMAKNRRFAPWSRLKRPRRMLALPVFTAATPAGGSTRSLLMGMAGELSLPLSLNRDLDAVTARREERWYFSYGQIVYRCP